MKNDWNLSAADLKLVQSRVEHRHADKAAELMSAVTSRIWTADEVKAWLASTGWAPISRGTGKRKHKTTKPVTKSAPTPAVEKVGLSDEHHAEEKAYVYNESTKTYVFALKGSAKPVIIPGSKVEELVRAYSNLGEGATINQCSRSLGLPRNKTVKILQALGITHDSLPWTVEDVVSRPDEDLLEDARTLRTDAVYRKVERAAWNSEKEDALKWRRFDIHVLTRLEAAAKEQARIKVPKLSLPVGEGGRRFAAVVGLSDFHWAKRSDMFEVGEEDNRTLQRRRLLLSTQRVLADVLRHGMPERLIVPVAGDFFNVDQDKGCTTDNTPQDMDTNPAEMLATGCQLMVEFCEMLRQVGAPLELVLCSGNHDRLLGTALLMYLSAWFRDTKDVTVRLSAQPRQYTTFGKVLLQFAHGDLVSKTDDLARLAAAEQPRQWGETTRHMAFVGHIHTNVVDESAGYTKVTMPSLSGKDRWHSRHGYVGNRKQLAAILLDADDGMFAVTYAGGE